MGLLVQSIPFPRGLEVRKACGQDIRQLLRREAENHLLQLINRELLLHIEDGAGIVKITDHIRRFTVSGRRVPVLCDELIHSLLHIRSPAITLQLHSGSTFGTLRILRRRHGRQNAVRSRSGNRLRPNRCNTRQNERADDQ